MKPETRVIQRIRDGIEKVDNSILVEKTNNPYIGGILDLYIECYRFVGHIEVKFRPTKYPADKEIETGVIVDMCSAKQKDRFKRHVLNRVPARLLCGFNGPNQRNRTYCLIDPIADHASADIIWPSHVTVLDLDRTVFLIRKWISRYEIRDKSEME